MDLIWLCQPLSAYRVSVLHKEMDKIQEAMFQDEGWSHTSAVKYVIKAAFTQYW